MVMFMNVGMIVLITIPFNSSSGGIGIHAGLRNQCRKACGFESHLEDECYGVVKLGDTGLSEVRYLSCGFESRHGNIYTRVV